MGFLVYTEFFEIDFVDVLLFFVMEDEDVIVLVGIFAGYCFVKGFFYYTLFDILVLFSTEPKGFGGILEGPEIFLTEFPFILFLNFKTVSNPRFINILLTSYFIRFLFLYKVNKFGNEIIL